MTARAEAWRPPAGACVLLTGATGFIGGRLLPQLVAEGFRVRAIARRPERLEGVLGVEVVEGDLTDPASLEGVERGVHAVIHAASILGKWGTGDERIRRVNVEGSLNLLERFRDSRVERYLHLSAGGVTGPVESREVDETYAARPATPYERTKLEAERETLARAGQWGIPAVVVRPTFTYGPGDPHKLPLFRAVKRGRYVFIDGGGSVNHPVFIDDLIAGLSLALRRGRPGEIYIIGGPRPVTKKELVEQIADALGARRPTLSIPRWLAAPAAATLEMLGRRLGFEPVLTRSRVMMMADNFGYSIRKAVEELGYEPQTALKRGIEVTVESYCAAGKL